LGTFAVYYPEPREPKEDELHWVDSATHLAAIAIMKNQGELALRRSEARYRQILETTHEGVISLDIDAKVKFANRRAGEMLGYGSSELLGRNVSELLDPSERRKVEAMLARRRRGMSDQYEVHMRTREGRDLWVIIASSAVVDESGEVAGMLGMLTDITHRKQTEIVLGRSEAELRTMFESAAIGMALVDPITRPVKCNPALEKFLAYSAAELGQTTLLELTHSDDLLAVLEKKRLLDLGEYDSFQVEARLHQKAGQYAWARITISQIRLPDGTTPNAVVMVEDIREGKRLEKEIRAAERLRALIFDSVGDVLYYIGVEGNGRFRFLSVNETFLRATGLRQEQVIGRFVDEVIPQPSLSLVLDKYERAILERRTQKWDEVSVYPSGTKYGDVTVTPLFDQDGRCTGLVGTVHDITERKYAEERIAAQAALLDHARDAILLRALDETVRYWNEGAARLYG